MKEKWLKWSKISLLLVCLGFFMPVSCDMNGVDLAKQIPTLSGYLILLSIIFTLTHTKDLEKESVIVDWILLGGSISGGLFSLGRMSREYFNLQVGAYVIIAGWILSLIFLIIASCSHTQKGS